MPEVFFWHTTEKQEIRAEQEDLQKLLQEVHNSFYLVNVVDNDFINGDLMAIFDEVIEEIAALDSASTALKRS